MAGYLRWALSKLAAAPATSCAFWIDLERVLLAGSPALEDVERQIVTDDRGHEWQVVRHRSNPFLARRQLASPERTVVWCTGMPGDERVDLTAFEDHLGRAWHVLDVSLSTLARERHPGMDLPSGLDRAVAGISFDAEAYLDAIADQHQQTAVTTSSATDLLAAVLIGHPHAVMPSDTVSLLASAGVASASAPNANAINAVRLALRSAGDTHPRLRSLAYLLASLEPRDIVAAVYVGAAFGRQQVPNLGSVVVADGWWPSALRDAFEAAGGKPGELVDRLSEREITVLSRMFEATLDATSLTRVREALASGAAPIDTVAADPQPATRLLGIAARFNDFCSTDCRAAGPGLATERYRDELAGLDAVAEGVRQRMGSEPVPNAGDFAAFAEAWARSSTSMARLRVARAEYALRSVERLLSAATVASVRQALGDEKAEIRRGEDRWGAEWHRRLSKDVTGFLKHPIQGWRLSQAFADSPAKGRSWLLVFDGLRYDLWRGVVAPAIRESGWELPDRDVSFAFLPSITEVGRRLVVGGSPRFAHADESAAARALADRAGKKLSYSVRSEHFDKHHEDTEAWNVRVFSWPDKFVHTDVADLGTLSAQFESWVRGEFVGWLQASIPKDDRVVVTTDHGFAELAPDDGIVVNDGDTSRNSPRMLANDVAMGDDSLVVPDRDGEATIATGRRWFRGPGSSPVRFAHGGCSLDEVVVPFAELASTRASAMRCEVTGLPDTIEIDESSQFPLRVTVLVTGGTDMFPTIVLNANRELLRRTLSQGAATTFDVLIPGEEGLDRIVMRVMSGTDRKEWTVPVRVKLAKIKRAALDFD